MNKQSITAKTLREIVTGFRKIVPRNDECFRQVKIDLASGLMTVTDGRAFLSHQLNLHDQQGGSCFLSFDRLVSFAKGLPARQEVLFEVSKGVTTITSVDRRCFAKPVKPEDSFVSHPSTIGKTQSVTSEDRNAILRALICASTDDTRPVLPVSYTHLTLPTTPYV